MQTDSLGATALQGELHEEKQARASAGAELQRAQAELHSTGEHALPLLPSVR